MKCEFCGSNIEIEQLYCPNCGKKNTHAEKHQREMQKYKQEFKRTRDEVIGNSKRFNTKTALISIVCVLAALCACCFLALSYSYEIRSYFQDKRIAAEKDKHVKNVEKMMSEHDYNDLYFYIRYNKLDYSYSMRKYDTVFTCARTYHSIYNETISLFEREEIKEYDQDSISMIAGSLVNLKEYCDEKYMKDEEKTEENLEFVAQTKEDARDVVVAYFKLTDEEAAEMYDLTKARLTILLEDAYNERK